jgi:hypothetical protein
MVIYASFSVAVVDCVSWGLSWVVVVVDTGCAAATTCGRAAGDSHFFYLVDISISCPIVTEMILTVPLPFLLSVACCHFRSVSRVVRPRRRPTDVAFFTVTDSGRGLVSHGSEQHGGLPLG